LFGKKGVRQGDEKKRCTEGVGGKEEKIIVISSARRVLDFTHEGPTRVGKVVGGQMGELGRKKENGCSRGNLSLSTD